MVERDAPGPCSSAGILELSLLFVDEVVALLAAIMSHRQLAAWSGALAVMLGAFGAHALKAKITPDDMDVWKTASSYHFWHTLAMLASSQIHASKFHDMRQAAAAGAPLSTKLFAAGILVFSGSLYALVITQQRKLGAITPIGGVMLIGGWVALAYESSSA